LDRQLGRIFLPLGESPAPVWAMRAHLRWDVSEILWMRLWAQYVRDPNTPELAIDGPGGLVLRRPSADRIGLGLSTAARF
ncbi:MAG: hypothetical protein OEY14_14665, partial [Myxococcales bacterium]|nr:hypothetical protein [Myxococcales bacterium]